MIKSKICKAININSKNKPKDFRIQLKILFIAEITILLILNDSKIWYKIGIRQPSNKINTNTEK